MCRVDARNGVHRRHLQLAAGLGEFGGVPATGCGPLRSSERRSSSSSVVLAPFLGCGVLESRRRTRIGCLGGRGGGGGGGRGGGGSRGGWCRIFCLDERGNEGVP